MGKMQAGVMGHLFYYNLFAFLMFCWQSAGDCSQQIKTSCENT